MRGQTSRRSARALHITDQAYGDAVFRLVGSYFSEIRPAATMIVCNC